MTNIQQALDTILEQGCLPLFFHADLATCIGITDALYRAGVKAIEFTNRGEAAMANLEQLRQHIDANCPGMLIGVGTIKNEMQAEMYLQRGADFLVSPGLVVEVAHLCIDKNVLYAPGCMTPTEIMQAEAMHLPFIKLFPGNVLGPGFMSAIKELFKNLHFMPTGGVDATQESMKTWFDAGVSAVGMGSKLISKSRMDQKDYAGIEQATREVLTWAKAFKSA